MASSGRFRLVLVFSIFAAAFSAETAAQQQTQQTKPSAEANGAFPPADTKTKAVLGVAEFQVLRGRSPGRFLGRSAAGHFLDRLSEIKSHTVGEEERLHAAERIIAAARRSLLKEIDGLYAKRDALLFPGLAKVGSEKVVELSSAMDKARAKLRDLDYLASEDVEIVREKTLGLAKTNLEGRYLDPVKGDPLLAAAAAQADYLVYGTVEEELSGYFTLDVKFYGVLAERVLYGGQASGELEEMDTVVEFLFQELADAVVGRPWTVLDLSVEPKEAGIFIDGNLSGIGKMRFAYAKPGVYKVDVRAPGYEAFTEDLVLLPSERKEKKIGLVPLSAERIILNSIPPGADVYFGSERAGNLPLTVEDEKGLRIARLRMEGYKDEVFPFDPKSDPEIHLLPRSLFSWEDRIEAKREDFYTALGWFVLSVPVPVILYGIYQSESYKYFQYKEVSGYDKSKARGMAENCDNLYYSFLGGVFISGSLLLNAGIRLFDYIRVGEAAQQYPDRKRKD